MGRLTTVVAIATLVWLCTSQAVGQQPGQSATGRVSSRWPASAVVPIRSIDPEDDNFADLRPLKKYLGKARIIQLGEQSHGDGATFFAKQRLIRFLHKEMGFNVLAWEAGFFRLRGDGS